MCGRFTFNLPHEILAEIFGLREPLSLSPRFNVAPTQQVPVIRQCRDDGGNRLDYLRWGLIPSWAKDPSIGSKMINARCETVAEKPAFRQAIRYRRCIVLASGFYEWKQQGKAKQPWHIRLKGGRAMPLAGLWESWRSPEGEVIESCTILTTAANPLVASLHDRMPVILPPVGLSRWLNRQLTTPADLADLYEPYPGDRMELWPVSPLVNNARNESPELVLPLSETPLLDLALNPT